MDKANISVTTVPCSCGFLQHALQDQRFPLRFDAQFNEYFFDHRLPDGETLSIRLNHCPVCGGVTSKSKRGQLFADLSDDEMQRIHERLGKYKSAEDITRALGAPDLDENGDAQSRSIRVLTYKKLSKTADVRFTVYQDGRVEGAIAPKYLGPGQPKRAPSKRKKKKR